MSQPSDQEWKQILMEREQLNKQILQEGKQLEKAKKEMLNQQYQLHENGKQQKHQEKVQQRQNDYQQMEEEIVKFRGEKSNQMQAQKKLQSYLSLNYQDQINQQKQYQLQEKQRKIEEDQQNISKVKAQLQLEEEARFKQKQYAKEEMANFFNNKKRLESEKEAEAKAQKDVFNEMANESSLLQIGKEQNYKKYYQQFTNHQLVAARSFIPFDNNKEKRIQDLIDKGVEQDRQRYVLEEEQRKQNVISRRLDLKTGLQMQLAYKEKSLLQNKQALQESQNDILQKSLDQQAFENQQRMKKKTDQLQYRDVLKSQIIERDASKESKTIALDRSKPESPSDQQQVKSATPTPGKASSPYNKGAQSPSILHNPLLNPLPANMQNPYLLKQLMNSQSVGGIRSNEGRMNYANLAQSNIVPPQKNYIF